MSHQNIQYTDTWYGDRIEQAWVEGLVIDTIPIPNPDGTTSGERYDTTSYGSLQENKINGFSRFFQMSTGVNMNTTRYFTKLFKKGFIRGIRHVAKPRVGFTYTPDYTSPRLGYYKDAIVPETPLNVADTVTYNTFSNGIYGSPSQSGSSDVNYLWC